MKKLVSLNEQIKNRDFMITKTANFLEKIDNILKF